MRFDLLTLELFIAVCEEQSISRAAVRAHTVASAVSKRISDLERGLKTQLFYRQARGLRPTPAAEVLLRHARLVLRDLAEMESEIAEHGKGLRGQVRIRSGVSSIIQHLAQDLGSFLARYPGVRIDLEEDTSREIIAAVAGNAADIGIFGSNVAAPGLQVFPYRSDRLVALVRAGHPLGRRKSVRFADLLAYDLVAPKKGSALDALVQQAAAELGHPLKLRLRVNGFETVTAMVEAGLGVGLVPQKSAERYAVGQAVHPIRLDERWAVREWKLCVRDLAQLPTAAARLVAYLSRA
ncbi:MAG TPA: LysR family transcriptional regulator [Acetobacteraceae bacterium]|nr:LysR family transcriptional regulator [Acetobacteraceae bacterium]